MTEPGSPISYMVLERGTPVYSSDGVVVGQVDEILAAPEIDIFDGICVNTEYGLRFADAPHVAEIYERRVELDLDAEACRSLPNPEDGPDAFGIDWQNAEDPSIGDRIRSVFEGRFGDLWKRR